jgi:hypothetical protein
VTAQDRTPAPGSATAPRLYEFAFACHVYAATAGFDATLDAFRKAVGSAFDSHVPEHRLALFTWLNSWGCRQFAKEHHETTASRSLLAWSDTWLARLPGPAEMLTDLGPDRLAAAADAYEALRVSPASQRKRQLGGVDRVTYGPTGAAKTLFALRPEAFPPWDEPIRMHNGYDGHRDSYLAFLVASATTLSALAREAHVQIGRLPAAIGRPGSSAAKLVDEFAWVAITRRYPLPGLDQLRQWAEWAAASVASTDAHVAPATSEGRHG